MSAPKKLYVKTYGCQMNVYDSERMTAALAAEGYAATEAPEEADLILLNTCHIREKASEKVYSEIGRLKELREEKEARGEGRMTIAIAGCVAQAEGKEIMHRAPAVDLVIGPQAYHQLPELIARTHRSKGERLAADFAPDAKFDALTAEREVTGPTAFLTVQEGCDKFCTFCVVPYTRGAEWSRPVASILDEARALAAKGVREVTLLGQNVNAYNGDDKGSPSTLARLAYALAEIGGLDRIRYTTSHPNDMGDDLIDAHRDLAQLMPYLHLPVQSGSDKILRAMNRKHGRAAYIDLIARIKAARPDLALSGDFIVGFPGETDKDFEDTLDLVRSVGYASAFTFKYSPRPGTPAASLGNQVPEEVMDQRLQALNALIIEQQQAFKTALVGRTLDILFEKKGRFGKQAIGRSPYLQSVYVEDADHLMGQIVPVHITAVGNNSLQGALRVPEKA
jgi:tRNA-2-methylthio-N6-dimethylallyladenosine synthase